MGLERWDPTRRKWILYSSQEEHSADCENFPFDDIPARLFLDTNVVNLMVKYRAQVFEQDLIPETIKPNLARDIEALMHVVGTGFRANWNFVVSRTTIEEIECTQDPYVRDELLDYALEVVDDWSEDSKFAQKLGLHFADAKIVEVLPDVSDRVLLGNAIGLGCDVFCTRDHRTIVSKRHLLPELPIRILTPVEWWAHVKPWAGLWL